VNGSTVRGSLAARTSLFSDEEDDEWRDSVFERSVLSPEGGGISGPTPVVPGPSPSASPAMPSIVQSVSAGDPPAPPPLQSKSVADAGPSRNSLFADDDDDDGGLFGGGPSAVVASLLLKRTKGLFDDDDDDDDDFAAFSTVGRGSAAKKPTGVSIFDD
jgi:hypothetical protein